MSGVNITVYDGKNAQQAAQRAEAAAREAKEQASVTSGALTDPIPPGTESEPAVIPPGPAGQKVKFEPEPGFYQGFDEVTSDKRWYFYWSGSSWSLVDMGELPNGHDGVDGASLLKEWSTTSTDYPYKKDIQVRYEKSIYVSLVDNNSDPVTDETKWLEVVDIEGEKLEQLWENRKKVVPKRLKTEVPGVIWGNNRSVNPNNGNYITRSGWKATDLIPLKAGETVELYARTNDVTGGAFPNIFLYNLTTLSFIEAAASDSQSAGLKYFTYTADSDIFFRATSASTEGEDYKLYIVKNEAEPIDGFVPDLYASDLWGNGSQYDTSGIVEVDLTGSLSSKVFVKAGDKLIASVYTNRSTSQNFLGVPFFNLNTGAFTRNLVIKPSPGPGNPVDIDLTFSQSGFFGISTKNNVLPDYNFKILRSVDNYSEDAPIYVPSGDVFPQYVQGNFYTRGSTVKNEGVYLEASKDTIAPATPESEDWNVIGGGESVGKVMSRYLSVGLPVGAAILELRGVLPTDTGSNRTPTRMEVVLKYDNSVVLSAFADVSIQGDTSSGHLKKGYAFDMLNGKTEELKVKFGSWTISDGFHVKAYWGDELLTRDIGCNMLWRQMLDTLPFPDSWIAPVTIPVDGQGKKYFHQEEAKFITQGFPCVIYHNGDYLGAYIWRQKKNRENYRVVKENSNHLWLEALGGTNFTGGFRYQDWEIRNPGIPGYISGGPISDIEVLNKITRLNTWVNGVFDGAVDFESTWEQYIDLQSFVRYIVFTEFIYNVDGIVKNYHLFEWGTGVWTINPYDLDHAFGYRIGEPPKINPEDRVLTKFSNRLFNIIYSRRLEDIKSEYARLKTLNVISVANMEGILSDIPARLGQDQMANNFSKWSSFQYVNFNHRSSIQYLLTFLDNRIRYLDSIWV